ncbi:hypothetical protein PMKS-000325 [Pichia membranifaciens]|uniref:Uncharacterized protein n=1 Tax=Pichia membranifaciens TaxID=4926 RepID=A0A1Q2YBF3_9ASCO|nr:hypothetical protein PMKS-000325 [Pichia membranifaciens]
MSAIKGKTSSANLMTFKSLENHWAMRLRPKKRKEKLSKAIDAVKTKVALQEPLACFEQDVSRYAEGGDFQVLGRIDGGLFVGQEVCQERFCPDPPRDAYKNHNGEDENGTSLEDESHQVVLLGAIGLGQKGVQRRGQAGDGGDCGDVRGHCSQSYTS